MIGWLFSFLPVIGKGLDYFIKKADGDVIKAVEMMKTEQALVAARRDVMIAGMSHPIWWLGWALFVAPLGVYWAKVIVWDKVLKLGVTDPLTGLVADWAGYIVVSLFGLQLVGGLGSSVINRLTGGR